MCIKNERIFGKGRPRHYMRIRLGVAAFLPTRQG